MTDLGIDGLTEVALIGRGGFGEVYRARQAAFNRDVACKMLPAALDADARRRFDRECRALGSLGDHPFIVDVYSADTSRDGRPYLLMPYVRGGSLASRLSHRGLTTAQEATALGVKLAAALHTAHHAGVLHRDIKPANVLMTELNQPLLADFGIAQVAGAETSTMSVSATLAHASPETLEGTPSSVSSDLYSLGSTLYTILSGRPAFSSEGIPVAALIARVLTSPVPSLSAEVPAPLQQVLLAMMAKKPADRPRSALEVGRALQHVQRQLGWPVTDLAVPEDASPVTAISAAARPPSDNDATVTAGPRPGPAPTPGPVEATRLRASAAPPPQPRPPHPPPPAPHLPPATGRRGSPIMVFAGVAVVLLLVGAFTLLYLASRQSGTSESVVTVTTTTSSSASPSTQTGQDSSKTSQAPPATTAAAALKPVTATVENTCGANHNGDCFLSERSGPRGSANELRRLSEGSKVQVVCQVHGTNANSSVLGSGSDIWSRTTDGGYVATIFLSGVDKFAVTTPCP